MQPGLIRRFHGILRIRPTFVRRFYPDLNRLGQRRLNKRAHEWLPERWVGASVEAINAPPTPPGGLSMIDTPRGAAPMALRELIRAMPVETIGERLLAKHGPEF